MAGDYGPAFVGEDVKSDVPTTCFIAQRQLEPGQIMEKSPFGLLDPPPEHDVAL